MAVGSLVVPLFVASVAILGYAHYRAWIVGTGLRTSKLLLIVNTVLVIVLWAWRIPF